MSEAGQEDEHEQRVGGGLTVQAATRADIKVRGGILNVLSQTMEMIRDQIVHWSCLCTLLLI